MSENIVGAVNQLQLIVDNCSVKVLFTLTSCNATIEKVKKLILDGVVSV